MNLFESSQKLLVTAIHTVTDVNPEYSKPINNSKIQNILPI